MLRYITLHYVTFIACVYINALRKDRGLFSAISLLVIHAARFFFLLPFAVLVLFGRCHRKSLQYIYGVSECYCWLWASACPFQYRTRACNAMRSKSNHSKLFILLLLIGLAVSACRDMYLCFNFMHLLFYSHWTAELNSIWIENYCQI